MRASRRALLLLLISGVSCLVGKKVPVKRLRVICTKKDGRLSKAIVFDEQPASLAPKNPARIRTFFSRGIQRVRATLRATFLPSGRVPEGFRAFSFWSWIHDISQQLRALVATQRVMEGVGMSREVSMGLSVLTNFIVTDGAGMAATLMVTSVFFSMSSWIQDATNQLQLALVNRAVLDAGMKLGKKGAISTVAGFLLRDGCGVCTTLFFTSFAASRFKADVKRWRLFADAMVDLGITLEVAAILVPRQLFLPTICLGNMCKAMYGVAAGACDASIKLYWAKYSDVADINAKFAARQTITGGVGLFIAVMFAGRISDVKRINLGAWYAGLTLLHFVSDIHCIRLMAFDSFNTDRMDLVLEEFMDWWKNGRAKAVVQLSTPKAIAKVEPVFFVFGRRSKVVLVPIHFGVSVDEFCSRTGLSSLQFESALRQTPPENYLVAAGKQQRAPCVVVSVLAGASPEDHAKAYLHATLLGHKLKNGEQLAVAEETARNQLEDVWDAFVQACEHSGWDLSKTALRSRGYELELTGI